MYRQYESPYALEDQLADLRQKFCDRIDAGEDLDDLVDLQCDIEDLQARIRFAWADQEADMEEDW